MLEPKDAAGFGKDHGDVSRSVVAHHLTTIVAVTVETSQSPTQEADRFALLLSRQHHVIGKLCGVVDGHMDQVVRPAMACVCMEREVEAGR